MKLRPFVKLRKFGKIKRIENIKSDEIMKLKKILRKKGHSHYYFKVQYVLPLSIMTSVNRVIYWRILELGVGNGPIRRLVAIIVRIGRVFYSPADRPRVQIRALTTLHR